MPYKQRGSKYWWISYSVCGEKVRKSSRTTVYREAKALENQFRAEAAKQRGPTPQYGFDRLMDRYLDAIAGQPHFERNFHATKALYRFFSGKPINALRPPEIANYGLFRQSEGARPGTVLKELRTLSAAIKHAISHWEWDLQPLKGLPKAPAGRVRWITRDQAQALIAAARRSQKAPYLADMIILALNSGMRRGEILGLEWSRVDLDQGLVYLGPPDQKGKRHGSVPLNAAAIKALRRQGGKRWVFEIDGRPIGSIKRSFSTAVHRAGIDDFRFHDLRHTCAAWLVQSGVSIRQVAEILRHKDIQTTMRYAHLAPENVREAADRISFNGK